MSYFDNKHVPKREERLRTGNAFGGNINQLVEDNRQGCLVNRDRSFSQTCNCQMGLALAMILTIPDTVIIMHGPVGCGSSSHGLDYHLRGGLTSRGEKPQPLMWYSTNLDENDIINGGEKKLEEAIIDADLKHQPSAIIIVSSCTPGIIGDDIDNVAINLQPRVMARLVPVHCEGFKTKISATAYDAVYHGIGRNLLAKPGEDKTASPLTAREQREKKQSRPLINVFNVFSIGYTDEVEVRRLLNALGLEVNFFPNFAHPNKFIDLTKAELNVSICATHDDYFLEFLQERYGIPYIINTMPIGISNTNEWILDIAKFFGLEKEANQLIAGEVKDLQEALLVYQPILKGKRVYLSGGEIRVAATAILMRELGCEVLGFRAHHFDQFGDALYLKAAEGQPNLEVNVSTTQPFELVNLLKRAQPDLYLGHGGSNAWAAKLGIPTLPIFSTPQTYLGYRGVFEVAKRSVRLLQNPAFQRNLQANTRQPYRESWYEKNPFTYITE